MDSDDISIHELRAQPSAGTEMATEDDIQILSCILADAQQDADQSDDGGHGPPHEASGAWRHHDALDGAKASVVEIDPLTYGPPAAEGAAAASKDGYGAMDAGSTENLAATRPVDAPTHVQAPPTGAVPASAPGGVPYGIDDPLKVLTTEAQVAGWNSELLPSDRISTENGAICSSCARWPLMIDPQLQEIGRAHV